MHLFAYYTPNGIALGIKIEAIAAQAPISAQDLYRDGITAMHTLDNVEETASLLLETNLSIAPVVPYPGKILCVGFNYAPHAREIGEDLPDYPIIFAKFNNALAGDQEAIPIPHHFKQVDYEAELAVVIGKKARNVSEEEALDYVLGYTIANDISERGLQFRTSQYLIGKTPDKFLPIGRYLITADEVPDPQNLTIQGWLNGELRQKGHTSDMIFSVAQIISYISQYMTLNLGDIICTGTPQGVIKGFPTDQQVWLKPGDEYTIEIERIGRLTNRFVGSRV